MHADRGAGGGVAVGEMTGGKPCLVEGALPSAAPLLRQHGFVDVNARVEPAPEPSNVGTLIAEARRMS